MKFHPIFHKPFHIWWIIMAIMSIIKFSIFGFPSFYEDSDYGYLFYTIGILLISLVYGSILYLIYRLFARSWNNKIYMILISIMWLITLIITSLKNSNNTDENIFEESFKEQENKTIYEYLDSTNNVYSNFLYNIAFDAPNNWEIDAGVSKHTILRAFQKDSAITFSINVIEQKLNITGKRFDMWEFYQENKKEVEYQYRMIIENQLNTKIENLKTHKAFLKNNVCVKRQYIYKIRDIEYEYYVTNIVYQTLIGDLTYTFALSIPKIFYDQKEEYYNNIFSNIYFLINGEFIDGILKQ